VAYWWVSQNQTYVHESSGGYLWAPKADQAGNVPYHWKTMLEVRPGDVVFSYVDQKMVAVSVATSLAIDSDRPGEFGKDDTWIKDGWRIDATYQRLQVPLSIASVRSELQPLLPTVYSPLNKIGGGNQGYLFHIPPRPGRLLEQRIEELNGAGVSNPIDAAIVATSEPKTVKQALIQARIGQGQFRSQILDLWKGRCCVTQIANPALLRASHIKPWRDSNNAERLDKFNGLLLSPAYDAAFDAGLITFADDGKIRLSPVFPDNDAVAIGINPSAQVDGMTEFHMRYLAHHRTSVFLGA
jgi:putative restriction endonuclease